MSIRMRSVVWGLVGLLVLLAVGGITMVGWEVVLGPKARPVTDRRIEPTEARLTRGKYLVESVAHCFHCHSDHDFSDPDYPPIPGREGAGWLMPIPELGKIASRNITSDPETGLGRWTDDEILRALQEGVSRDGSALFPVMPYPDFAQLDDEDAASIVAYIRTIPPVRNVVPERELVFPLNFLVNTMPAPKTGPKPTHPSSTPAERGEYLVTMAGCGGCHTPAIQGEAIPGLRFGGGEPFHDPGQNLAELVSLNITPDPSGIAHYDEARFITLMRSGRVEGRIVNHIMPLSHFKSMTDDDLKDIWAFISTRPPVKHRVSNTDPPTDCTLCKRKHGLGDLN